MDVEGPALAAAGRKCGALLRPPAGASALLNAPILLQEDFETETAVKPDWKVMSAKGFDRASILQRGQGQ